VDVVALIARTLSIQRARFSYQVIEFLHPIDRTAANDGTEGCRRPRCEFIGPSRKAVDGGDGTFFVEEINAVDGEQHLAEAGDAPEAATHAVGGVRETAPVSGVLQSKLRLPKKGIDEGVGEPTTAHVRIDVGGQIVTASITNEAVDDMQLAVGQTAYAIVKATSVMVAID
jgi:molybdopterin-binding protein